MVTQALTFIKPIGMIKLCYNARLSNNFACRPLYAQLCSYLSLQYQRAIKGALVTISKNAMWRNLDKKKTNFVCMIFKVFLLIPTKNLSGHWEKLSEQSKPILYVLIYNQALQQN